MLWALYFARLQNSVCSPKSTFFVREEKSAGKIRTVHR